MKQETLVLMFLGVFLSACLILPAWGQGATFLKISGVDGESTDKDHGKWIDISSYSSGLVSSTSAMSTRSSSPGMAGLGDISITKILDKTTPKLATICNSGQHIPEVVLELVDPAGTTGVIYTMRDVVIKSIQSMGALENVTLSYNSVRWEYTGTSPSNIGTIPSRMITLTPTR